MSRGELSSSSAGWSCVTVPLDKRGANNDAPRLAARLVHYREKDLQKQVTSLRDQLKDLHTSNESTQAKLVNASQRQDQDTLAKLAEVDMVVSDLARANERVAAMERRNEMLRSEIESVRSGSEGVEK
jgi:hypothetical protein